MPEIRSSGQIKTELQQVKQTYARKSAERDVLKKQLEALESEIKGLLREKIGGNKVGKIAELEQELHSAQIREYKERLPKPVLTLEGDKRDKSDYRIDKITAKRIYITAVGSNNDFHVNRDSSYTWGQRWAQEWGLDIEATTEAWEQYQANNSPTRKP